VHTKRSWLRFDHQRSGAKFLILDRTVERCVVKCQPKPCQESAQQQKSVAESGLDKLAKPTSSKVDSLVGRVTRSGRISLMELRGGGGSGNQFPGRPTLHGQMSGFQEAGSHDRFGERGMIGGSDDGGKMRALRWGKGRSRWGEAFWRAKSGKRYERWNSKQMLISV
jgi:hypothetical protein